MQTCAPVLAQEILLGARGECVHCARERLLQWLLLHASGKPATVRLDQTWTEVADEIALTREAVYRAVAELKRCGVLQQRGQTLLIDAAKSTI